MYVAVIHDAGTAPSAWDTGGPFQAGFDTAQEAWQYLVDYRVQANLAWEPDRDDPEGPQHLDVCQVILEMFADTRRTVLTTIDSREGLRYSVVHGWRNSVLRAADES